MSTFLPKLPTKLLAFKMEGRGEAAIDALGSLSQTMVISSDVLNNLNVYQYLVSEVVFFTHILTH